MLVGLALITKSGGGPTTTVTATATEWEREPLVPVTVTVYVPPAVELELQIETFEAADPPDVTFTDTGLITVVRPDGELEDETVTVPLKPLVLAIVIVENAQLPWGILRLVGEALILKSAAGATTVTETIA